MVKLLIAVDGSEPAGRAIEFAGRLAAQATEVQALLFNVHDLPAGYGDLPNFDAEAARQTSLQQQAALLEEALAKARACGLQNVQTLGAFGLPAAEIAREAAERGVELILMGTRGRNVLAGLLLGSVAQRVAHLASVPVLLVK